MLRGEHQQQSAGVQRQQMPPSQSLLAFLSQSLQRDRQQQPLQQSNAPAAGECAASPSALLSALRIPSSPSMVALPHTSHSLVDPPLLSLNYPPPLFLLVGPLPLLSYPQFNHFLLTQSPLFSFFSRAPRHIIRSLHPLPAPSSRLPPHRLP